MPNKHKKEQPKQLMFVYGTLRCGCEHIDYVKGSLYNLGAFPGFVLEGDGLVEGELHRVTAQMLTNLDAYEGVGRGLYRREKVETLGGKKAWVYIFTGAPIKSFKKIESGKWQNYYRK